MQLPQPEELETPVVTPAEPAPAKVFSIADLPPPLPSADGSDEEDDEDDSIEGESEAPLAALPALASENNEEPDRWAGTMAREWEEPANDAEASPPLAPSSRLPAPAKTLLPKREPEKPVHLMSLAEAAARIPPDAAQYLRTQLRAEVTKVRPYKPTRISRDAAQG